jgi:hypothetical protein
VHTHTHTHTITSLRPISRDAFLEFAQAIPEEELNEVLRFELIPSELLGGVADTLEPSV